MNGSQWSMKHGGDSTEKNGPPRLPEARRNLPYGAQPGIRPCLDYEQMSAHHVFDVGSPVGGAAAAKRADALHHLMITTFGTRALSRRFKLPDEPSFRTYLRKEIASCPRTAK